MADILETLECISPPQAAYDQYTPAHSATWLAKTKMSVPGDHALLLSQGLIAGGLPAGATPVPKYGDRLFWAESEPKQDTGQTVAQFEANFPLGYADGGAYALDFDVSTANDNCHWAIGVTWRKPNPGMNQSAPRRAAFRDPLTGLPRLSTEDGPNQAVAVAAREHWLEYRTEDFWVEGAFRVTGGDTIAGVRFPMLTPAGEKYPPMQLTRPYVVQVISRLMSDPGFAMQDNVTFGLTTNNATLQLGSYLAPKHTVYFESSRSGRPREIANQTYYDLETRLVVYGQPRFVERPAAGSWYLDAGQRKQMVDFDGNSLVSLPLKSDGTVALVLPAEQAIDVYSLEKEVSYAGFAYS